MKIILTFFLAWAAGSYLTYRLVGTSGILPYAGVTIIAAVWFIWRANRKA